jgi:hypothetical protein
MPTGASVNAGYKVRGVDYYPLSEEEIHEIGFLNDTASDYYSSSNFWSGITVAIMMSFVFSSPPMSVIETAIVYIGAPVSFILAYQNYLQGKRFKNRKLNKIDTYRQQAGDPISVIPPSAVGLSRWRQLLPGTGAGTER